MYEVLVKACSPNSFLINLAKKNCVDFKVLYIMPTYKESIGGSMILEFSTCNEKIDEIVNFISNYHSDIGTIEKLEVEKKSDKDYYVLVNFSYYFGMELFVKTGCIFNSCECTENCVFINIFTGSDGSLNKFMNTLVDHNYKVEIVRKRAFDIDGNLTNRQRDVLKLAYEQGYFDIPKRISLKELSKKVGISPSSTDEIIKRAQKKIVSSYLIR